MDGAGRSFDEMGYMSHLHQNLQAEGLPEFDALFGEAPALFASPDPAAMHITVSPERETPPEPGDGGFEGTPRSRLGLAADGGLPDTDPALFAGGQASDPFWDAAGALAYLGYQPATQWAGAPRKGAAAAPARPLALPTPPPAAPAAPRPPPAAAPRSGAQPGLLGRMPSGLAVGQALRHAAEAVRVRVDFPDRMGPPPEGMSLNLVFQGGEWAVLSAGYQFAVPSFKDRFQESWDEGISAAKKRKRPPSD